MSPVAKEPEVSVVAVACVNKKKRGRKESDGHNVHMLTTHSPQGCRREHLKLSFSRSVSESQDLSLTGLMSNCETTPKRLRPTSTSSSTSLPSSPACPDARGLDFSFVLSKTSSVSAEDLAQRLRSASPLVIDCRSFMAFNACHVAKAVNINCCDRFNRRRLQQGKVALVDLVSSPDFKRMLSSRSYSDIVVYDDNSRELSRSSHSLLLLLTLLIDNGHRAAVLLGGIRGFETRFPDLCANHLVEVAHHKDPRDPRDPDVRRCEQPRVSISMDIESEPATRVLPFLYLGNVKDASDASRLKEQGIKYVLNVTAKDPDYVMDPHIVYKQLRAADNGLQNLWQFFEEAFDFIDRARRDECGVLVHCQAGVSRSPTIALAYLIKHFPMALAEAYKFVKMRRSIISPNLNFMGQLFEFEQGLNNHHNKEVRREPRVGKCESWRIIDSFLLAERRNHLVIQSECAV